MNTKKTTVRQNAILSGYSIFSSGKPCKRGHISDRYTSSGTCIECSRAYREMNLDRYQRDSRESYARHSKKRNEVASERIKKLRSTQPWGLTVKRSKPKAKKRGIDFSLTTDWAASRWTGRCELTGIEFNINHGLAYGHPFSPSIDRIDSEKSYSPDNCRFILNCVNTFRSTMGDEQMLLVAAALISQNARLAEGIPVL